MYWPREIVSQRRGIHLTESSELAPFSDSPLITDYVTIASLRSPYLTSLFSSCPSWSLPWEPVAAGGGR